MGRMRQVKRDQFKRLIAIVENPRVEPVNTDWAMADIDYLTVALEFDSITDANEWERIFGWTPTPNLLETGRSSLALAVVYRRKQPETLWERYMKAILKYQKWLNEYLPSAEIRR